MKPLILGMNRPTLVLAAAAILCGAAGQARADFIYWNSWTSNSGGSMTVGATPVTVSFATSNDHADVPNYPSWTPATSWADGVVVNNAPVRANGIMQLDGGTSALNTLTFSTPVENPVIAIWSLGQPGLTASFVFNATPVLIAGGPSAEYGGSSISVSGNTVLGNEGNGTVEFVGTYSSITWTNPQFEFWYGFDVGSPAPAAAAAPEPASLTLLAIGAVSIFGYGWRRRKRAPLSPASARAAA
jgi:hypothetical protein